MFLSKSLKKKKTSTNIKVLNVELNTLLKKRTSQITFITEMGNLCHFAMTKLKILDRSLFPLKNPVVGCPDSQREVNFNTNCFISLLRVLEIFFYIHSFVILLTRLLFIFDIT